MFVVADGGTDLECFDVRSAAEARSILLQARNPLSFHANGWQLPQDCTWRSFTFLAGRSHALRAEYQTELRGDIIGRTWRRCCWLTTFKKGLT